MEGRRRSVGVRTGDERERRGGVGGATRDLRDHVVCSPARWAVLESSAEGDGCNGGWAASSVVGVLGGVREEASPSR